MIVLPAGSTALILCVRPGARPPGLAVEFDLVVVDVAHGRLDVGVAHEFLHGTQLDPGIE